jgi:hypothetical protein
MVAYVYLQSLVYVINLMGTNFGSNYSKKHVVPMHHSFIWINFFVGLQYSKCLW